MPHGDALGLQGSESCEQHLTVEVVNVAMCDNARQVADLHAPSVEIHVLLQVSPEARVVGLRAEGLVDLGERLEARLHAPSEAALLNATPRLGGAGRIVWHRHAILCGHVLNRGVDGFRGSVHEIMSVEHGVGLSTEHLLNVLARDWRDDKPLLSVDPNGQPALPAHHVTEILGVQHHRLDIVGVADDNPQHCDVLVSSCCLLVSSCFLFVFYLSPHPPRTL